MYSACIISYWTVWKLCHFQEHYVEYSRTGKVIKGNTAVLINSFSLKINLPLSVKGNPGLHWFAFLYSVIGPENLCQSLNQSITVFEIVPCRSREGSCKVQIWRGCVHKQSHSENWEHENDDMILVL